MKILASWIRDFVSLDGHADEAGFVKLMHRLGVEVSGVTKLEDDIALEIEVTSNRPDLLSHFGMAREIAALLDRPLAEPAWGPALASGGDFAIEIVSDNCHRYCGLVMENVTVKDSPDWMKKRLEAVGLRPISNIVDITNYLLMELNHPLHAFDLDKLDTKIVVRQAKSGEKIRLLDEKEYTLTDGDLVIADATKSAALAGIMGGSASAVSATTKRVLMEAAWFVPASIRRSARRLAVSSDSSYRFERGADYEILPRVMQRMASLIAETAGGTVKGGLIDARRFTRRDAPITFRAASVERTLGHAVPEAPVWFKRIGCRVDGDQVIPPSWRLDLVREIDLVEEVARFDGYDRIGLTLPPACGHTPDFSAPLGNVAGERATRFRKLRERLVDFGRAQGLDHCMTFSFESARYGALEIANPLNSEMGYLRRTLLPSLCRVAQLRLDRSETRRIAVYEMDKAFEKNGEAPAEHWSLAMLVGGTLEEKRYDGRGEDLATLDHVTGLLRALAGELRLSLEIEPLAGEHELFTDCARVKMGGVEVGACGALRFDEIVGERSAASSQVKNFFGCEIDLYAVFRAIESAAAPVKFRSLPRFPAASRDLAFAVAKELPVGEIEKSARAAAPAFLEHISIFDIFALKDKKSKSVAIRLTFRAADRTLTEEEITSAMNHVVEAVSKHCGATLRSH